MVKSIIALAVIIALVIIGTQAWEFLVIMLCILLAIAVVLMGPSKFAKVAKETFVDIFDYGQRKIKETSSSEELEIHDVDITHVENKYIINIYTEKGKLSLAPRSFAVIPDVLKKGKKVTYTETLTITEGKIKKKIHISAVGEDGEERIFYIE